MGIRFTVFVLCLLGSQLAMGQAAPHVITNSDVISMTKAGIGEHTIILAIQRGPVKFDISPEALIALKRAGVSDQVLNAILSAPREVSPEPKSSQSPSVSQSTKQPSPVENVQKTTPAGKSRNACTPQPGESFAASAARTACCEKGFGSSCSNLARFYATGTEGLPKDLSIANVLKRKACEKGEGQDCSFEISDPSERMAFENAVSQTDSTAEAASLNAFLQVYPQSAVKQSVLEILAKLQAATNASPPPTPNASQTPNSITSQGPPESPEGLILRVLQEQSVPYTQELGGGISTSCNIVGTANTSAYATAYGNSAYGNATTNSNQRMSCNSYDTTMRWQHVLNVMFVQASDGNSYIIACDRAWRWSKCNPLRAGEVFSARFTGKGIEVEAVNSKGKEEHPTYKILQSRSWR